MKKLLAVIITLLGIGLAGVIYYAWAKSLIDDEYIDVDDDEN